MMVGSKISHYKILEKLGEGGMGVVYKAEDTRLHREVALKFLSAELTADSEAQKRFIREARTASALDHPHICTIYDIDESDEGHLFIAMPHYDGTTLKDRLLQGPLSVQEALEYAVQIAEGLAAAHARGIVHRDLKPANIFITEENVVKILDFGVAKLTGAPELTRNGVLLGTTHYMAPEQLTGQAVDHRADIWALGVILYEMLSGKQPFDAETDQAIMYAILEKNVPSLRDNRPEIPSFLDLIVKELLKKEAGTRYQKTTSFLREIDKFHEHSSFSITEPTIANSLFQFHKYRAIWIGVSLLFLGILIFLFGVNGFFSWGSEVHQTQSIRVAVLPFENRGPEEHGYFAVGITEELISRLNSIHTIDVIAQYSTNQYQKTQKSYQEIGHELSISYVVTGTIFCYDSVHIRIIPRITRVKDGVQIWSHQYDEQVTNLLSLQSSIAERIFQKVGATLHPAEQIDIASTMTKNFDAYRWYLQGVSHFIENSMAKYHLMQALQCYQNSARFDPEFALVFAKMAEIHTRMYHFNHDRSIARIDSAAAMLNKALALQPELPEAHLARGWFYYSIYRDYEKALSEYRLASEQYPKNPDILFATAAVYRRQGDFEQSLELFKESFSLDPRNPRIPKEIGITLSHLRRYDEALQYFDLALQIDPDYKPAYERKVWMWWMGKGSARETREWVYNAPRMNPGDYRWLRFYQEFYEHDYHAALARLDSIKQSNKEDARWFETGYVYRAMGEHANALAAFDSARQRLEGLLPERDSDYGIHMSLAKAYAALGWKKEAYDQLALAQQDQKLNRDSLYVNSFRRQKAHIHLLLGEHEQALNILDSQLQKRTNFTIQWVLLNPNWKPIWNHPRFLELAREYNIGNTFAFKNP